MTRICMQQVHCPNCKCLHSFETSFSRWIRNNKQLDSAEGYCVIDQDFWISKYKVHGNREFQLLMMVEIKTFGAELSKVQRDRLHIVNQLMRNRRMTPTKELKWQPENNVTRKATSIMLNKEVNIRVYGVHLLTFSKLGPDDSEWIKWDCREITEEILTKILRFDLDPDTLRDIDLSNHHITKHTKQLSLYGKKINLKNIA